MHDNNACNGPEELPEYCYTAWCYAHSLAPNEIVLDGLLFRATTALHRHWLVYLLRDGWHYISALCVCCVMRAACASVRARERL